jgi:hypothetical protein
MRMGAKLALAAALLLEGCAEFPGRCELGVAHEDCAPTAASYQQFPGDDVTCRSYGLKPGTYDYLKCRTFKANVDTQTKTAINAQWYPSIFEFP